MVNDAEKEVIRKALVAHERLMFATRAMRQLIEAKLEDCHTLGEFVCEASENALDESILADRELNQLRSTDGE